jgi:hypothetical protein
MQWSKHDSKKPRDQTGEDDKLRGPSQKNVESCRTRLNLAEQASSNSERNWRQGPTCRRGKDLEDLGTDTGRRRRLTRPRWAQAGRPRPVGLGWPAQPNSRLSHPPPFDLAASRAIYSPLTESDASIHSSSAAEEQRSLRDTLSERRVVLVV